ncbi:hypothetical protein [Methylophilus sp. DW102]|uniref:hypothetical protein n=1 Tax=Methylophilus sp. DW102 TaxID=3095607 RepID=UPI00308669F7|nr:hypothetical protein MTDW_05370 [Methylophilus sp. DW102]
MKKGYKTDKQLKAEIRQINELTDIKKRIHRLNLLMFDHVIFKKMSYQDLASQIKLHTQFEISEDLLRQYGSKKPQSKTPSTYRLKLIAGVAKKIDPSDKLLESIYQSIETCEEEELFEKSMKQSDSLLRPIFEKSIEFQNKYESKLEEIIRVLSDFQPESEMVKLVRKIYAIERNKKTTMDSISVI